MLGAAGHVGQELEHIGAHRVVGEVVFDAPDRVEPERLGLAGQPELVGVDLVVGPRAPGVLEDDRQSNVHTPTLGPRSHTVYTGRTFRSRWDATLCTVTQHLDIRLTPQEQAVYAVLSDNAGRVLSRAEIARRAGIADLSDRRCDSLIVGIRRQIGADHVRTVRRRGWMLDA